ncbi:cytochrome c biogenesis protein CcsA [Capnocytophaga granulosa]|uniref:cytochrome c biogenesis protein n=1 Tax=Capnocytophaga granulosa TaxID=45242 RepID=UPI003C791BE2
MLKKLTQFLISTRLMAVLFLAYGAALAMGTFVETWYNTDTAKIWIYNAWWFELIMALFVINFIGNIGRYRLLKRENWAVFVLHASWIFIIVGAAVTRYISDEGKLALREGEEADFYTSELTYITAQVDGTYEGQPLRKAKQTEVLFSEFTSNSYSWSSDFKGKDFRIDLKRFIAHAEATFVADPQGESYLKIVEAAGGEGHEHYLKSGATENFHGLPISLNNPTEGAINLQITPEGSYIHTPYMGSYMTMGDQKVFEVAKDSMQPLQYRCLYNIGGMRFVLPEPMQKGKMVMASIPEKKQNAGDLSALMMTITCEGETKEVEVIGRRDEINPPSSTEVGGLTFHLSYGSVRTTLPFKVKLDDFIADKYPGTERSYSSFKSKVTVTSPEETFKYDIYMNNILNYKGYRFFQANFFPDEKGTILSVNHDFWGTLLTYIGYTLLYIGLIASMFFGKTRFVQLSQKLKKLYNKRRGALTLLALFFSVGAYAQHDSFELTPKQIDSLIKATTVKKEHADRFAHLVIQDEDGRMKPINTFASELLRKVSKADTFRGLDANQVFLSMLLNRQLWYNVDFFYIKKDNDSLHKILGVEKGLKRVRALDFLDKEYNNKLNPYLVEAYSTSNPNQFQKEFKEVDTKMHLLERALSGSMLRIFPLKDSPNNKWISPLDIYENPTYTQDTLEAGFIKHAFRWYLSSVKDAVETGNYSDADKILTVLQQNQRTVGKAVIPSEKQIEAEILYNKYDVFKSLFSWYLYVGTIMFVVLIARIFKERKALRITTQVCTGLLFFLFALHTAGLAFRWYISGHAPWSDAYESMIYVAWATMGIGLCFARRSPLSLASTAFVTSMILMIAHWNWLDPSIGNLQPVLNSYWLMLHVAVIVGSYGPFTLGMILGAINLLLMILTTAKNREKIKGVVDELTIVNELALTVGLIMLTIGNFLGAQWANESWGRYWGWDPKETWALVSIMVYAFVIHMRIVPSLRGIWGFNFASVVAFASILMTYFGVNFYLSGLHSYASGEKVITPNFVYYAAIFVIVLGIVSFIRRKNLKE